MAARMAYSAAQRWCPLGDVAFPHRPPLAVGRGAPLRRRQLRKYSSIFSESSGVCRAITAMGSILTQATVKHAVACVSGRGTAQPPIGFGGEQLSSVFSVRDSMCGSCASPRLYLADARTGSLMDARTWITAFGSRTWITAHGRGSRTWITVFMLFAAQSRKALDGGARRCLGPCTPVCNALRATRRLLGQKTRRHGVRVSWSLLVK